MSSAPNLHYLFVVMTDTPATPPRPRRLPRFPHRYAAVLIPFVLALFMTSIVSSIATIKAVGLAPDLAVRILQAWALSFVVAFPCVLVLMPLVRKLVSHLVEPPPGK